jgi:pyruvate dehydrogenase E1 component alpha subunit
MDRDIVFRGEIPFLRILDEDGQLDSSCSPELPDPALVEIYAAMLRTRLFDERVFLLQREGRLGTYAQVRGQEAAQIGSAFALGPTDWVVPAYRESGVLLCRGIPMQNILLYWGGDERGMLGFRAARCLPCAVPVGTQIPHAVGVALAGKLRHERLAVACYFGDGATSTGDFHEALTMAGVMAAPVVFFCQNNQWAISVPRARQCAAQTLAQKAFGYGIAGIQVDGNDVVACYSATKQAVERARDGGGATLIEALTYRLADHTTADDASRYRDRAEVEMWQRRDPLRRLRAFLERRRLWSQDREDALVADCAREIDEAIHAAESIPPPDPADVVRYTYASPPAQPGVDRVASQTERTRLRVPVPPQ